MDIIGGQHLRQMWDDLADVYGHKTALICESPAYKTGLPCG
ncbi:putative crotonobetaine/carnitine-CoA ligase domain protein [Escherichia coli T1840_97]|nr:putative crotonobetaine/carnitine-CoA ligase domain protein [Escherichia coli T1840_97]